MGFASSATYPVMVITLPVYLGECWKSLTIGVTYIVVDALYSYISVLGLSTLNHHGMVHSSYYKHMKFPMPHVMGVVRGDQFVARNCYVHSVHHHFLKKKESISIQTKEDPKEERGHPHTLEGLRNVKVNGLKKTVQIGAMLIDEEVKALSMLMVELTDLFS